jgi:hypothetical protein
MVDGVLEGQPGGVRIRTGHGRVGKGSPAVYRVRSEDRSDPGQFCQYRLGVGMPAGRRVRPDEMDEGRDPLGPGVGRNPAQVPLGEADRPFRGTLVEGERRTYQQHVRTGKHPQRRPVRPVEQRCGVGVPALAPAQFGQPAHRLGGPRWLEGGQVLDDVGQLPIGLFAVAGHDEQAGVVAAAGPGR